MSTARSVSLTSDSRAGTRQSDSNVPSSPMTELSIHEGKPAVEVEAGEEGQGNGEKDVNGGPDESMDSVEDTEDMDSKAKALMTLLKTSKVSY